MVLDFNIFWGKYLETSDQGFRRDFHRLTLDLYKKKPFFPNTNSANTPINPTPYVEMVILYDPKFLNLMKMS